MAVQGTGFTNLQNILAANRPEQMASTIGSDIQRNTGQFQKDLGQQQQTFQMGSQAGNVANQANQNTAQGIINQAANTGNVSGGDISKFQSLAAGQYTGPQGLQNAQQLQQSATQAQQLGQDVQSSGGRQALLQRMYGSNPQYTSGQQRFDTALLGNTTGLNQARRGTVGLANQVNNAAASAQTQAQGLTQAGQQFGQQLGQNITAAIAPIQTAAQNAYTQAGAADAAKRTAVANAQAAMQAGKPIDYSSLSNILSPQDLAALKANPSGTFNVSDATNYTQAGVMTPQQQAQINALNSLAGNTAVTTPVGGYQGVGVKFAPNQALVQTGSQTTASLPTEPGSTWNGGAVFNPY